MYEHSLIIRKLMNLKTIVNVSIDQHAASIEYGSVSIMYESFISHANYIDFSLLDKLYWCYVSVLHAKSN